MHCALQILVCTDSYNDIQVKSEIWGRRWKQLTFSSWRRSIPLSSVSGEVEHEDIDKPVCDWCSADEEEEEEEDVEITTG